MTHFIGWKDADAMLADFEEGPSALEGADLIFAAYWQPPWEGSALVYFERGGELFEVDAGHCSCNGLEGQWNPKPASWNYVLKRAAPDEYSEPEEREAHAALMEIARRKLTPEAQA